MKKTFVLLSFVLAFICPTFAVPDLDWGTFEDGTSIWSNWGGTNTVIANPDKIVNESMQVLEYVPDNTWKAINYWFGTSISLVDYAKATIDIYCDSAANIQLFFNGSVTNSEAMYKSMKPVEAKKWQTIEFDLTSLNYYDYQNMAFQNDIAATYYFDNIKLISKTSNEIIIFDPETYGGVLRPNMSKVTIDNNIYLQVVLDGWKDVLPLDNVYKFSAETKVRANFRYKLGPVTADTLTNYGMLSEIVQLMDTLESDKINVSWSVDPVFCNIAFTESPVTGNFLTGETTIPNEVTEVHKLQVFGQEHITWGPTFGDTIWVGKITTTKTSNTDLILKKANVAPTIDGNGNDEAWTYAMENFCNKTVGIPNPANFKMTYDDNNIYVLVSVTDTTPNQNGTETWQYDNVELLFAMDTNNSPSYRPGDWSIKKIASKSQADGGIEGSGGLYAGGNSWNISSFLNEPNFIVAQTDGIPYVQEWQIPISRLVDGAYFDGQNFRFDIQVADNDGTGNERTGQSFWNSNADNQWNVIQNHGYVKLAKPLAVTIADIALSPDTIYFSGDNDTNFFTVSVNSGITMWGVSSNPEWISFQGDVSKMNGNATVEVYAAKNPLIVNRTGNIEIFWTDILSNTKTKKIVIVQANSSTGVSTKDLTVDADNLSSTQLNVGSDGYNWTITCQHSWLTADILSGLDNTTITLTAQENPYPFKRTTTVTFSYTDTTSQQFETTITITQLAETIYIASESNSNASFSVPYYETIDISGYDNTWLTVKDSGTTITLTAQANTSPAKRSTSIEIKGFGINSNFSGIVEVVQYGIHSITINKTISAPVIDGVEDETIWSQASLNSCNQTIIGNPNINSFKLLYDDDNIYALVKVDDATPNQDGSTTYFSDNVELYFAMDTNNRAWYANGDWQIRKRSSTSQADGGIDGSNPNLLLSDTSFVVNQADFGSYYIQEWQIPIKTLVNGANFDGENFRFDVQVADNDGTGNERTGQCFWHSTKDDLWNSVGNQGYVKLAQPLQVPAFSLTDIIVDPCRGGMKDIAVKIINNGHDVLSLTDLEFSVYNMTSVKETFNTSIAPGDSAVITFSTKYDFSAKGDYSIKVSAITPQFIYNPSITKTIFSFGDINAYEKWKSFSTCDSLTASGISRVMKDSKNNMWATESNGLARIDTNGTWTHYKIPNPNNILSLTEDLNNNIWVAVDNDYGYVMKFDGTNWTTPDSSMIHTVSAFTDSKGNLWFGSWEHGVYRYDGASVTNYSSYTGEIPANIVVEEGIMEDSTGNIWIASSTWGSGGGGLTKFNGETWFTYSPSNSPMPTGDVACSMIDSKGNIWLGHGWTGANGLTKFDGTYWTNYTTTNSKIISDQILCLFEDSRGNIWIGSNIGLSMFDGNNWMNYTTNNSGLLSNSINSIAEAANGDIWVANERGISIFTMGEAISVKDISVASCEGALSRVTATLHNFGSKATSSFEIGYTLNNLTQKETAIFALAPGETKNYTFTAKADLSVRGNPEIKVFTNISNGDTSVNFPLVKNVFAYGSFEPYANWKSYTNCDSLSAQYIDYILKDSKNNMWITEANGLLKIDTNGKWTHLKISNPNGIRSISEDSNNNIWLAVDQDNGYVMKYDGSGFTIPDSSMIHNISSFVDSKGNLWIGTWEHGVYKYDGSSVTNYSTNSGEIPANIIWKGSIMEDPDNNIWIASTTWGAGGGGLTKFNGETWFTYNPNNSPMPTGDIACALLDSKGNFWLGHGWTGNFGVTKYDGTNWSNFNTGNSKIISDHVLVIFEDSKQNIWFGTENGISVFNGSYWTNYTQKNSGLLNNPINCFEEDADGNIWIGTDRGISIFTPEKPAGNELTINKVAKAPVIDGTVTTDDPWGQSWIALSKPSPINSSIDMVSKFQMAYDDKNIYVITHTTDVTPLNDVGYNSDCSELYFAMDTTSSSGIYKAGDFQIRKIWNIPNIEGGYGTVADTMVWNLSKLMDNKDFHVAETVGDGYYVQEWQIPWNSLIQGMKNEWDGKQFKFDMAAKDQTSSGYSATQLQMWNSNTNEQWHNTNYFGLVKLSDAINKPIATDVNLTVAENSTVGTVIGLLDVTDADVDDSLVYELTSGNESGLFAINGLSKEISLAQATLDFETQISYSLVLKVTDKAGLTDSCKINISVTNINETPGLTGASYTVAENTKTGTVLGTLTAIDEDASDVLTFTFNTGNIDSLYIIDPSTGSISLNKTPDFENLSSYKLIVQVTDKGSLFDIDTVSVNITDINETPVLIDTNYTIAENTAIGTNIGILLGFDIDADDILTYSIISGNVDSMFTIGSANGELKLNKVPDYEKISSYTLEVKATDVLGLSATAIASVSVSDVNEAPEVSDASFTVSENAASGSAVGTVSASDVDAGDMLTYAIVSGNTDTIFELNSSSGAITLLKSPDYEKTTSYSLTISASDKAGLSNTGIINISVTDINEKPSLTDATLSISENSGIGSVVGTIKGTDNDASDVLEYAIIAGNSDLMFTLNASSGALSINQVLDFEKSRNFTLAVKVTDKAGLNDSANITVNITNVNEQPSITGASYTVSELTTIGTTIGTISANDPDGDNFVFSIIGGNTNSAFAIDGSTGIITVNSALDYETTASYSLLVQVSDGALTSSITVAISIQDAVEQGVVASFNFKADDVNALKVIFTSNSTNATNLVWTFGDGTTLQGSPVPHTYSVDATYKVCLTAINSKVGATDKVCKSIVVGEAECRITSSYTYSVDDTSVTFSNNSTGNIASYYWNFGDGTSSSENNPLHHYEDAGIYVVGLSVADSAKKCTDYFYTVITVGKVACHAAFDYIVDTANLKVTFKDISEGDISKYYWDFNDGKTSSLKNPDHAFAFEGTYEVSLTISNSNLSCMDNEVVKIQVGKTGCNAEFTYYVDSATNTAYFTNSVNSELINVLWSFGDGRTSSSLNPVHKYAKQGYFTVGLNTYNTTSKCIDYKELVVLVGSEGLDCEADFIYQVDNDSKQVTFTDKSVGDIDFYIWNFGNGVLKLEEGTSNNPTYKYSKAAYYNVCLTVINSHDISNITCKEIAVATTNENSCKADFNYSIDSISLQTTFIDASYGNPNKWEWDMGDGSAKLTTQNPVHNYTKSGYYLVSLKSTNTVSGFYDKTYEVVPVDVYDEGLVAMFGYDVQDYNKKAGGYPVDFIGAGLGDQAKLKWSFGDENSSENIDTTTTTPTHVYDKPGTYTVCYTVSDPVTGESTKACEEVVVKDGVKINNAIASLIRLDVYPNPVRNNANIKYYVNSSDVVTISIFDINGQLVNTISNSYKLKGDYSIIWDVSTLANGTYYLNMKTKNGSAINKVFLKQ